MSPARCGIGVGGRDTGRAGLAPGRHGHLKELQHTGEKLGRLLNRSRGPRLASERPIDVEHAPLDAVVGRVLPDHRLVGGRQPLRAVVVLVVLGVDPLAVRAAPRLPADGRRLQEIDDAAGVGLDEFQKPPHPGPAGGRVVGHGPRQPAAGGGQPDRSGLLDRDALEQRRPVHEQPGGAVEIALVQERVGGLGMAAGRRESRHLLPPESGRGGGRPQATAAAERLEHLTGRFQTLASGEMRHARHRRGGVLVPPARQLLERGGGGRGSGRVAGQPSLSPDGRVGVEDRAGRGHEVVDAGIGQALAAGLVKRKLPGQPEDVPGIDRRPAAHRAKEKLHRGVELAEPGPAVAFPPRFSPGRHHVARDPREQSGRGRGHRAGEPFRGRSPTEPGHHGGQRHVLHLAGPAAGQDRVDVLPHATEGLPQPAGLLLEPVAMVGRQEAQQPAVEGVAVAGDPRQELAQTEGRLRGGGAAAGEPRGHQDHAGQHRRRLEFELPGRGRLAAGPRCLTRPRENPVERRLLQHHPPVAALLVDPLRIPEAEQIVGPAGGRMEEVEGPGIESELLHRLELEVGLVQEFGGRRGENLDRAGHEIAVPAMGGPGAGSIERHRPDPFMRIGLRQAAVLEHRHRPPADVVVEPLERRRHQPLVVIRGRLPGGQLGEQRLGRRHHEERPLDPPRRLMLEKVCMKAAVGLQRLPDELEHAPGLSGLPEGGLVGLEFLEPFLQQVHDQPGRAGPLLDEPVGGRGLDRGVQLIHRPPDARIERPRGEVQIADDDAGRVPRAPRRIVGCHASRNLRRIAETNRRAPRRAGPCGHRADRAGTTRSHDTTVTTRTSLAFLRG